MTFADFLEKVGGMGRFQLIHTALLTIPILLMPSHNLLQNFTAAIPDHHCRIDFTTNGSVYPNATHLLAAGDLVKAGIPMNSRHQLEKCRRFVHAQWHLLQSNSTEANDTMMETEPCANGWVYDKTVYTSSIIIEVRREIGRHRKECRIVAKRLS